MVFRDTPYDGSHLTKMAENLTRDKRADSIHGSANIYVTLTGRKWQPLSETVFSAGGSAHILLGMNPKKKMRHHDIRGPIGTDQKIGLTWDLAAKRGHGLCFAATGTGKNTNIITPALLSYAGSVLCLDPKGENAWITANRRRQLGQKVVILDPYGEVNKKYGSLVGVTETTQRFNPLSSLDPRSASFNDDITTIADGIIITSDKADPHWSQSAGELISGLIAAVVEGNPGLASFRDVRTLLKAPDAVLTKRISKIYEANPSSVAAGKLMRFLPEEVEVTLKDGTTKKTKPEVSKEIKSIRSTAMTQTAIFDAADLMECMESPTAESGLFQLSELASGRVSLFIVLPAAMLMTHGRWMRLIIQLALNAIARAGRQPRLPVLFMLDELGTINPGGGLKMIEQAYGLLGGLGIRVFGFFQNITQLSRDYPETWETFISNCATLQVFRLTDNTTKRYFSDALGSYTIMHGNSPMARQIKLPHELGELPDNEVITFMPGTGNLQLPTIPYYLESRWDGLYRPNPLFPLPAWAAKLSNPYSYDPRGKPSLATEPAQSQSTAEKLAAAAGEWVRTDGKAHAEAAAKQAGEAATRAAEWAKTDGAAHARAASAAAAKGAAQASKWLGAKWRDMQAKQDQPPPADDLPPPE